MTVPALPPEYETKGTPGRLTKVWGGKGTLLSEGHSSSCALASAERKAPEVRQPKTKSLDFSKSSLCV